MAAKNLEQLRSKNYIMIPVIITVQSFKTLYDPGQVAQLVSVGFICQGGGFDPLSGHI